MNVVKMREELIAAIVIVVIVCATYLTAIGILTSEQLLGIIMAILVGIGFGIVFYYKGKQATLKAKK